MTEAVYHGRCPNGFPPDLFRVARRKPLTFDFAAVLEDLRSPPGNRLEPLTGDQVGQHPIRIDDQFRLCLLCTDTDPEDVECVDHH